MLSTIILNAQVIEESKVYQFDLNNVMDCNKIINKKNLSLCKDKYSLTFKINNIDVLKVKEKIPNCNNIKKIEESTNMIIAYKNQQIESKTIKDVYVSTGKGFIIKTCKNKEKIFYKVINKKYINEPNNLIK